MSPLTDARPRPEHLFQDGGKGGTGRDLEGGWWGCECTLPNTQCVVTGGEAASRQEHADCAWLGVKPRGGLLSLCLWHPSSEATHSLVLASGRWRRQVEGWAQTWEERMKKSHRGEWQREDGKVGKMTAEWSSVWEEERGGEGWGR